MSNYLFRETNKINLEDKDRFKINSCFNYEVNLFEVTLFTKLLKKFMHFKLEHLLGKHYFNKTIFKEMEISIGSFSLENLLLSKDH